MRDRVLQHTTWLTASRKMDRVVLLIRARFESLAQCKLMIRYDPTCNDLVHCINRRWVGVNKR